MTAKVIIGEEAEEDILNIGTWWWENRPAAPSLFAEELEAAIHLIAEHPDIGEIFADARRPGIRRSLLPRSKHWLYYVHDEPRTLVWVLRVWGAVREQPPVLP